MSAGREPPGWGRAGKDREAAGVLVGMKLPILPLVAVVAVGLATACGGGSSSDTSSSSASTPSSSGGGAYGYGSKPSKTPAPSSSTTVSLKTASGDPGTFLVDSKGRALYLWEADKSDKSTCSGPCAQAWPPLTTAAMPKAGAGVKASLLGTTKRGDGTTEVTYGGHPLYYFAGDSGAGQTNGQGNDGFGADWWVVAPNGKAIENASGT
jgi:predicted lipoprotein with Yx(FWY)xxD motif